MTSAATEAQQLYKCTLANGRVQYQQEPCADASRQSTVRPPDPVAPKSDAEQKAASDKSAQVAELQMSQVIVVIADASVCSEAPGWDAKYASLVQEWKARNGVQVAKFDTDQDARAKAIARVESERARFAGDKNRVMLNDHCEALATRLKASGPPAAAAKK